MGKKVLALGARLNKCGNVLTLGVKANFFDYNAIERKKIIEADKIYYPSDFYAGILSATGKPVFPSYWNYICAQDKVKQSLLFQMNGLPHPKTRFFYGKKQKKKILDYYDYPFIGKIPRGSGMGLGVFMILDSKDFEKYINLSHVAYIQEYLPISKDIRVIVVGNQVIHAYWRIAGSNEFRTNLAIGGKINFDVVPEAALQLALSTAFKCGWNDVGIDICEYEDRFYVIEANMKYGLRGFRSAGINYFSLMESLIENGCI